MIAPSLSASSLGCGYQSRVIDNIDLSIYPGELVAILGRNGCGKSTLLRTLSGVLAPHTGAIELFGIPLKSIPRRIVARTLAMVSQDLHIPFAYSVREVVELGRTPYAQFLRSAGANDEAAVDRALESTKLMNMSRKMFQQASGGEQQRTAIAMALAQEPRILLLDEPTVHLDVAHQMSTMSLLRELCKTQGMTVLASMHDINVTALYADRVIVLGDGQIQATGTPQEALTPDVLERAFGAKMIVRTHPTCSIPQVSLIP